MLWARVTMNSDRLYVMLSPIHVVPLEDLREHECSPECWCKPVSDVEHPNLWVHNSLDGREAVESGAMLWQ